MARNIKFKLDLDKFINDLNATAEEIGEGAKEGLDQIKDDWVRESRDVAPLSKHGGNLRKQINGESNDDSVIITANAKEKGFNYSYWLHEKAPKSTNLTTKGTKLKFLEEPSKENREKWLRWLDSDIKDAIKRKGW